MKKIYVFSSKLAVLLLLMFLFVGDVTAQMFFKSGGTSTNTIPFNSTSTRTQQLYRPGDFNALPINGNITKIYFRSTNVQSATYENFQVRMLQNNAATFPSSTFYTDLTTVLDVPSITIASTSIGGFVEIPLATPFVYDNTKTLIVEIIFTGKTGTGFTMYTSTSVGNKRINTTTATALTGTASTVWGDFGIDLTPPITDMGMVSFASFIPTNPGPKTITAIARNFGGIDVANFDIDWSVNGVLQPTYTHNTLLPSLTNTTVNIGTYNFLQGETYVVKAWTKNPNNGADGRLVNDTITSITFEVDAPLSGALTINNTLPESATNTHTLAKTLNRLKYWGVSSPVTINLAPGVYDEKLVLENIPGSSAINTVTFQSANGDSNSVYITSATSTSATNNYTLQLNNVSNVIFKNLTFERLGDDEFCSVVELEGNTSSIQFLNNQFLARNNIGAANATGTQSQIFAVDGSKNSNIVIRNNFFQGNANAVWFNGAATTPLKSSGLIIENNRVETFYTGFFITNQNAPKIRKNYIIRNNTSVVADFYPISTRFTTGALEVSANECYGYVGIFYGIRLRAHFSDALTQANIFNNFVSAGGATSNYGISLEDTSKYINVVNNSVWLTTTSATSRAFNIAGPTGLSDNVRVLNNNFAVTGSNGHAMYIPTTCTTAISASNRNNLYTTGTAFVFYSTAALGANMNVLRTNSGRDANSISTNPIFAGPRDLHAYSPVMNNAGSPVSFVTHDIDGTPRHATTPDIGADEYDVFPHDAGVTEVTSLKFCDGINPLMARVKNFGSNNLTTATINWSVNGVVGTPLSYNGNLAIGVSEIVTFGNFTATQDSYYDLKVWLTNPNGQPDGNAANDTAYANQIRTGLSGVYTVGNPSADFPTMLDAVKALDFGVCSPVTFNVDANSVYEGGISIPKIVGASDINRVVFNGNGSTIQNLAANANQRHIVRLDGADYVTIDGFKLIGARENSTTQYAWGVYLATGSDSNIVSNNEIFISDSTSSTNYIGIAMAGSHTSYSTAGIFNSNLIENNTIWGGYHGISLYSGSTNTSFKNIIRGNKINNFYNSGVFLSGTEETEISSNDISRLTAKLTSTSYGVYLSTTPELVWVNANRIHDLSPISSNTSTLYGIYSSGSDAALERENIISNNLIYNFRNNGANYGLYNSSSDRNLYYHNTVAIANPSATGGVVYGFYQTTAANGIELKNNLIYIEKGGTAAKYGIYKSTATVVVESDYNNVYLANVPGATGVQAFGYQTSAQTLAQWRTLTSKDVNTLELQPFFNDTAANDYNPTNKLLDNKGTAITEVTNDINGLLRTGPDIGAHEFVPPPEDLVAMGFSSPTRPLGLGTKDVQLKVKNGGGVDIFNFTTNWSVNGVDQNAYFYTGLIAPQTTDSVVIGSYEFLPGYDYTIKAWTSNPNTLPDNKPHNDTTTITLRSCIPMSGDYTLNPSAPISATNYHLFSAFESDLYTCGLSDTVNLDVDSASGPYIGRFRLSDIVGTSNINRIIIDGHGATVVDTFDATETANRAVLQLANVSYVTVKNFNFVVAQGSTQGYAGHIGNNSHNNTIVNNTFSVPLSATATSYVGFAITGNPGLVTTGVGAYNNNIIENNVITGGYYGVLLYTAANDISSDNIIRNNTIKDVYAYNIYNFGADNTSIFGNDIFRSGERDNSTTFYGIYVAGNSKGVQVEANRIHDAFEGLDPSSTTAFYGFYITANDPPSNAPLVIKNNLIYNIKNDGSFYGMYNSSSDNVHFYHNTISLDNPSSVAGLAYGFYQITLAEGIKVKNNIISIRRGGAGVKSVIYQSTATSAIEYDYNVLYVDTTVSGAGATQVGYLTSARKTLANWQAAQLGMDANSLDLDPKFFNPATGNFKPNNFLLENKGVSVGVNNDITGAVRNNPPDIGAYEFTPLSEDLSLLLDENLGNVCLGANPISAKVLNLGYNNVDSFHVNWTVNGVAQPRYTFGADTLLAGEEMTINLGTLTATAGQNYIVKAWTTLTNGSNDLFNPNDTAITDTLFLGLQGTFTVGGSGSNYTNLTALNNALKKYGVCGPVTVNVNPSAGPYNQPLKIERTAGLSESKPLVINGNGSVINFGSKATNNRASILLNRVSNVTVKNFIINIPDTATYSYAIHSVNSSSSVIKNNVVNINTEITSSNYVGLVVNGSLTGTSTAGQNKDIVIDSNIINGGYYSAYFYASSTSDIQSRISFTNNKLQNFYLYGLYAFGGDSISVVGNEISRATRASTSTFYGVYFSSNLGGSNISNNKIHSAFSPNIAANTSTVYALYIASSGELAATKRNILVTNNEIYNVGNNGANYAVYASGSDNIKFYHNSISLDDVKATAGEAYGFYQTTVAEGIEIINNTISVTKRGTGTRRALHFATSTSKFVSNNNNLYVANGAGVSYLTSAYATLATWRASNANAYDQNSISDNPQYNSIWNVAPKDGSPLVGAGRPNAWVSTDILGVTRSATTPTIGAYENTADFSGPIISYGPILNTSDTNNYVLTAFADITDSAKVDTLNKKPRIYYKRTAHANAYVDNTSATNGWKYAEATNTHSPFDFELDFSKLFGGRPPRGTEIQYFVVASDSLGYVGTSEAVNFAAPLTSSNLVAGDFPVYGEIEKFNIANAIAGDFYVGAGQAQTSLSAANGIFNYINRNIVGGDINIIVKTNTAETGAVQLNKWAEEGVGNYKINIIPDTTGKTVKTLSGSYVGGLIRMSNIKNVTIDGRIDGEGNYLNFANNSGTTDNATIMLVSTHDTLGSRNVTIRNTTILAGTNGNSIGIHIGGGVFPYSEGGGFKKITITENVITRGSVGIMFYGSQTSAADSSLITHNIIGGPIPVAANTVRLYGLLMREHNHAYVYKNTVRNIINSAAQQAYGMGISVGVENSRISSNNIYNVRSGSGEFGGRGLHITPGLNANLTVDNNFISGMGGIGTNDFALTNVGIYIGNNTSKVNLYYNSVYMTGNYPSAASTTFRSGALVIGTGNADHKIKNNTFINTIRNSAGNSQNYALYSATGVAAWSGLFDYNNFFVDVNNSGVLARVSTANANTLSELKTLTAANNNSINVLPTFASNYDLHVEGVGLYQKGNPIVGFDLDIDGETRPSLPSIGADEHTPPTNDIKLVEIVHPSEGVYCGNAVDSITVVIDNPGVADASGFTITAILTDLVNDTLTYIYTGTIPSGGRDTVSFATFSTAGDDTLNIRAFVNMISDTNRDNDTVTINGIIVKPVPAPPTIISVSQVCEGGTSIIKASTDAPYINWFTQAVGGESISEVDSLVTPPLTGPTTFYVEASNGSLGESRVGLESLATGTSGVGTTNYGIVFDVHSPVFLESVVVYPISSTGASGTVTIDIVDANGVVVHTVDHFLVGHPTGSQVANRVEMNFYLEPGNNYRMRPRTMGGLGLLFGPSASAPGGNWGYPFVLDGMVTITTSTYSAYPLATPMNDLYYYFFDWIIKKGATGCPSERVPVTVTPAPAPTGATFTQSTPFNGGFAAGTIANPDSVCAEGTVAYLITPPTGFNAVDYGTTWTLTDVTATIAGAPATGVVSLVSNKIQYVTSAADAGNVILISANVKNIAVGCVSPITRNVKVNSSIVVNLGADANACEGNTVTLDAGNPGMAYLWSTGATTQTINVTTTGNYTVTVTNASGCSASDAKQVTFVPAPTVNLGQDAAICQGSSITLDAGNAGATYLWSTGATTQTILASTAGEYYVTVTLGTCIAKDTINITISPSPVQSLGPDRSICVGSTTTLNAGNAGATYLWSTGATTQSITISTAGEYSVAVTLGTCVTRDTININNASNPIVALGADRDVCAGTLVTLDAGNTGSTYLWSNGSTTQTITVSAVGSYHVVVTNATGCIGRDTVNITNKALPVANYTNQIVDGSNGLAVKFSASVLTGLSYAWNFGDPTSPSNTSTEAEPTHTFTQSGSYTVTLTVTDLVTGCVSNVVSKTITVQFVGISNVSPTEFSLYAAPNPFAGNTNIGFELPQAADVSIEVFDMLGRKVADIMNNTQLAAGSHKVEYVTEDKVASGMYLVKLTVNGQVNTIRIQNVSDKK